MNDEKKLSEVEPFEEEVPIPPTEREALMEIVTSFQQSMQTLTHMVEQLRTDFDTKVKYDESKERTIDALHRELQEYRGDLVFKILRPLVNDLIALYDDMGHLEGESPLSGEVTAIRGDIEEIMARQGFEMFEAAGNTFDSSLQRVQRVIDTDDTAQDHQVARRVRRGVRYGDRLLRHEIVDIYRHKPE